MSSLISAENLSLAYGLDLLLDHVKFQINKGERVCLIGRNGAGKSSFLKIIEGAIKADSGTVWRAPHLRLARLAQELPQNINCSVYEFVAEKLADTGKLLTAYHELTLRMSHEYNDKNLLELEKLQHQLDIVNGWQYEQTIKTVLTKLNLDPDQKLADLSGGWQRRAALAQSLVFSPDLLLLDEPTNHLDIAAIQWLEEQLISSGVALLFITHDRALLQRLATRIIELDRGQLTSWPGDYQKFLLHKDELLHAEAKYHANFDKKLAQEEIWIRQGIKARRTRNEGRVRALEAMRLERSRRITVQGKASFSLNETKKSGQLVIDANNISHAFNDQIIINHFSTRIMRGDKVGLIGPNGIGKTTLLNILIGDLTPQSGEVTLGTKLQVAYFDQLRTTLDLEKTVIENVAEGSDMIEINGKKQHIIGYLQDFLFNPKRALTPVKALSGGECNRLLLARLFAKPFNLLIMDEPTNDLDIETLDLLEELLINYQGTLLVVSHDRNFLDNVVTSTLIFEGNGKIKEYVGGYQDWLRQKQPTVEAKIVKTKMIQTKNTNASTKLSYKEQKELDELPMIIENLEEEVALLNDKMSDPAFYQQNNATVTETLARLKILTSDIEKNYQRWNDLDAKAKAFKDKK